MMENKTIHAAFLGSCTHVYSTGWTQSIVALSALALGFDVVFQLLS